MKKKEYIGEMLLEDFKKLSYKEQGEYLSSLSGVILEDEDSIDINKLCQQISCSKDEYVKEHGYIPLTEFQAEISEIGENIRLAEEPIPEGCENWTPSQWVEYLSGGETFDDEELDRFIEEEIIEK